MAEQWQLRKGSTAENEGFIGAEGELTYDTTTKAVHIHDGETAGGALIDAVVAYQLPTAANNYTWYRKYASGWVEQGGVNINSTQDYQVILPIPMADVNYVVSITGHSFSGNNNGYIGNIKSDSLTTTGFKIQGRDYSNGSYQTKARWFVAGIAA
jgi:hypothetical protein